jgi:heptosyltransferase-2
MKPVCIRVPNWLGDSVMARPFVAAAQEYHDTSSIVLVAHARVPDLWRAWPGAEVIVYDPSRGRWPAVVSTARAVRRRGPYAAGYILPPSFSSALLFALGGAQPRVGFAADMRGWLLTRPIENPGRADMMHRSERYLDLLPDAPRANPPAYAWPAKAHESVEQRLRRDGLAGSPVVVAAVGTEGEAKRYSPERWKDVLRVLSADYPVVLVGTEKERRWSAEVMTLSAGRIFDWCGQTNLAELGVLLGRASAFVGADSGAAHLAASMDVSTVVIFGPGEPSEVRPLGKHVFVVREPIWCSPCRHQTCHRKDHPKECLDLVEPAAVLSACRQALGVRQASAAP